MRACHVYRRDVIAGLLSENNAGEFSFTYAAEYVASDSLPPVSLTLPKRTDSYVANYLFPCFVAMLAEGALASEQCRRLRLDERDLFGRLLATCQDDCIGSLRLKPIIVDEMSEGG